MDATSKRDEILDVAEGMIRNAGFNAFSTRDVASAVGIKASSVHYYFPTKIDMGVAVTERYTERFLAQLGDPGRFKGDVRKAMSLYVNSFRETLVRDDKLCLCAVLGAEIGGLPEEVGGHTRIFFRPKHRVAAEGPFGVVDNERCRSECLCRSYPRCTRRRHDLEQGPGPRESLRECDRDVEKALRHG